MLLPDPLAHLNDRPLPTDLPQRLDNPDPQISSLRHALNIAAVEAPEHVIVAC